MPWGQFCANKLFATEHSENNTDTSSEEVDGCKRDTNIALRTRGLDAASKLLPRLKPISGSGRGLGACPRRHQAVYDFILAVPVVARWLEELQLLDHLKQAGESSCWTETRRVQ